MRNLFEHLYDIYPEIRSHLLGENGDLRQDVPVFVNGRNPRLMNAGLDMALKSEDEICLFSPISSGRMNVEVMRSSTSSEQDQTR